MFKTIAAIGLSAALALSPLAALAQTNTTPAEGQPAAPGTEAGPAPAKPMAKHHKKHTAKKSSHKMKKSTAPAAESSAPAAPAGQPQ
jgi:hypothetical protein